MAKQSRGDVVRISTILILDLQLSTSWLDGDSLLNRLKLKSLLDIASWPCFHSAKLGFACAIKVTLSSLISLTPNEYICERWRIFGASMSTNIRVFCLIVQVQWGVCFKIEVDVPMTQSSWFNDNVDCSAWFFSSFFAFLHDFLFFCCICFSCSCFVLYFSSVVLLHFFFLCWIATSSQEEEEVQHLYNNNNRPFAQQYWPPYHDSLFQLTSICRLTLKIILQGSALWTAGVCISVYCLLELQMITSWT